MSTHRGVWDCHTHIYGPWKAFPLPDGAAYLPALAPMDDLLAMHDRIGVSHGVLVQAACYGRDHSALLDGIAMSGGRYRGVALVDDATTDAELHRLDQGGVRGVRFNFMGHLPGERNFARLRETAVRVKALNWHVLVHGRLDQILPVLDAWSDLDIPIVVDHMGRQDATLPIDEVAMKALERHLENPMRWVKLSGVDRLMQGATPPWDAALPLARRLLAVAPDRAIWGSDWPHPNIKGDVPDDDALLAFVRLVCADEATAQAVLCDNPLKLYV